MLLSNNSEQGSRLIVRTGKWESVIPALAREVGASVILTEEEVEYRPRVSCSQVEAALGEGCKLLTWSLTLFDPRTYEENYRGAQTCHDEAIVGHGTA